jgi:hypothetical protein
VQRAVTYTPKFRTDLTTGSYTPLPGYSGPSTNVNVVSVTDLSATLGKLPWRRSAVTSAINFWMISATVGVLRYLRTCSAYQRQASWIVAA